MEVLFHELSKCEEEVASGVENLKCGIGFVKLLY